MKSGGSSLHSTNFFLQSSCIRLDLLPYERKTTDKREQYDWRAEKNFDGHSIFWWSDFSSFSRGNWFCHHRLATSSSFSCIIGGGRRMKLWKFTERKEESGIYPSKFFSALQSYCPRLSVALLSYDSKLTLIVRPDCRKKFGRVWVKKENNWAQALSKRGQPTFVG